MPSTKSSRWAFTVPTMTLLPSTKPWLIRSVGSSAVRSPPVTLARIRIPFGREDLGRLERERAVAGRLEDQVERPGATPPSPRADVEAELTYRPPIASTSSLLRYGAGRRE